MIKTCFKSHLKNLKLNVYSAFEISVIYFSENGAAMLLKRKNTRNVEEMIKTSVPHLLQVCSSCCRGQAFCPLPSKAAKKIEIELVGLLYVMPRTHP